MSTLYARLLQEAEVERVFRWAIKRSNPKGLDVWKHGAARPTYAEQELMRTCRS